MEQTEKEIKAKEDVLKGRWEKSVAKTDVIDPFLGFEDYGWSMETAFERLREMQTREIVRESLFIGINQPFFVGNSWYEIVEKPQRSGDYTQEIQQRSVQAIKIKYGKDFDFDNAPKFDDFTSQNDILNYRQTVGRDGENSHKCFNRFPRPPFTMEHDFLKTHLMGTCDILAPLQIVHHIFGEQWYMGLQYLALLIQKPNQFLPVLCLVSKENQTGKSTFANLLKYMLGDCVGFYSNSDLRSDFNTFCFSHVAVFEEISNAKSSVDKIKDMATTTRKTINCKNEPQREYDVNVHIIINSNNETGFINASDDDIRYWVRKVPKLKRYDPFFDKHLKAQAKDFFYFLATFPHIGDKKSRMWFDPKKLETSSLEILRKNSKSDCAKSIISWALDAIAEKGDFYATVSDILNFEPSLKRYSPTDVRRALKTELGMESVSSDSGNNISYTHYMTGRSTSGKPYRFDRESFEKFEI